MFNICGNILKRLLYIMFSIIITTLILSLFCLIYNYTGIHINNASNATDYVWEPYQYKGTMVEGYAWLKMDKNGFNNYNSNYNNIDILLMGSSHMEALQVAKNENTGYLLKKSLSYELYNIGMSGHQIYHTVDNLPYALDLYMPTKYVLLETSTLNLDSNKMLEVINGTRKKITSYDNGIMYYAQKIPVIKSIVKKMQDWISNEEDNNIKGEIVNIDEYRDILYNFLNIVSVNSKKHNITPIIFYHPIETLNEDGTVNYNIDYDYYNIYKDICQKLGIVFVDTVPYFEKLFIEEHKLGHGFTNTKVGSGHLNKDGHRICAKALIDKINELEGDVNVIY